MSSIQILAIFLCVIVALITAMCMREIAWCRREVKQLKAEIDEKQKEIDQLRKILYP